MLIGQTMSLFPAVCNIWKTSIKPPQINVGKECTCLYERVSVNEPRSCSVDWLCSQKRKKRAEADEGRRRLVSVIKNSGGRQRIPMCSEWGHLVGYEEGCRPLPQLGMPPLCPSLSPLKLTIHNGFLWFNRPDSHTGSFHECFRSNKPSTICNTFLHVACITWFIICEQTVPDKAAEWWGLWNSRLSHE